MSGGGSPIIKEECGSDNNISSPASSTSATTTTTTTTSLSLSTPDTVVQGDEEGSVTTQSFENKKYDLKKKVKDKDKKRFFSGMSLLNIFSPPHHHKNSELHKIFTSLPTSEKLVDYYSCALQRDFLIHGRLYVTQSWLCFYANIFSWETLLTIPFKSVLAITKEKTALIIPNAIQVSTVSEKYIFTSLMNRDVTFCVVFKCWQNIFIEEPLSPLELVKAARKAHGVTTDVGTETDLWGEETGGDVDGKEHSTPMLTVPKHTEIGNISSTPILGSETACLCENPLLTHLQSIEMDDGGSTSTMTVVAGDAQSRSGSIGHSKSLPVIGESGSQSMEPVQIQVQDYGEKMSLEEESINITETETVSLMEETGEVPCGCSEHTGRTIINDVYDTDVETIFKLLFTNSDFMRNFNKAEKTIDVEVGEWQMQSDNSRMRDLSYTLALNYSFGPKFCHTTERQVYSKDGQLGIKHIVDTEVVNHNIPYGDTFYTVCRYCVTRVAHNKTRLRVTANIKFKKTCWGLVKNLIERNAGDGVCTHYTHLDSVLKEHVASLSDRRGRARLKARQTSGSIRSRHKHAAQSARPSSTTRSAPLAHDGEKNEISKSIGMLTQSSPQSNVHEETELVVQDPCTSRVNLVLAILLIVLMLTSLLLYSHLIGYNVAKPPAQPLSTSSRYPTGITKSEDFLWLEDLEEWPLFDEEWPTSEEEWQNLLNQQLLLRWKQTMQYKDTLSSMIKRLNKIESSLVSTKKEFLDHYNELEEVSQIIDKQRRAVHDKKQKKETES